ncbi:peptide chain release factor 1 [Bryobacter aggregatus]|uniref:peptide chain release factor 1 n=1 Tax=Bryobacter aggregatus TaxID=360054 RepID=UPI0004E0CDE8|nr:peptide chain release factor 1 [Bryobacter aggregatus]
MAIIPIDKLNEIEQHFEQLNADMANPEVIADSERYRKTTKTVSELGDVVEVFRRYKDLKSRFDGARSMLSETDADLVEMARMEIAEVEPEIAKAEEELQLLLVPKDPNDFKDVVLEIRAGAGGDEASLFAAEVFRMYTRYAELVGWKVEVLDVSESGAGGYKDVSAIISGKKVYSVMKYEGGVHRVQRVPATEAQGRIHTSTITVAVLPEADEVEVHIEQKDLRVDTFCSSGPGGQSVNTTYSAVRLTHIPTGVVVSMQDEKSQIKNREKAMRVLRSRLYELEMEKQSAALSSERKSMVGSGDRSEKIRTYNFKENRVTDHRIGLTIHQLDQVMEGKLDPFISALTAHYNAEKLKSVD